MAWWRSWPKAGLGLPTGRQAGVVVLDVDPRNGGDESLATLIAEHGPLPDTVEALTGGGGRHIYFAYPAGEVDTRVLDQPGLELKSDGAQVVLPPSMHPSGRCYAWEVSSDPRTVLLAPLPNWLMERRKNGKFAEPIPDRIYAGQRNSTLMSLAGTLRRRNVGQAAILVALKAENEAKCDPPLSEEEVQAIAQSVRRYEPEEPEDDYEGRHLLRRDGHYVDAQERPVQPGSLTHVKQVYSKWLQLEDHGALEVALATIIANRAPGDPVWTMFVSPPGGGKTEHISPFASLPGVRSVAVLTEAALLSGTSQKERASDATGGLLREVGDHGILLIKDFGSVLSLHKDSRGPILAALREIYDGSWVRHVGADGGRSLEWSGKCGLVAGATPAIDGHHAVMASLGERFAFYRIPETQRRERAWMALSHYGEEHEMRAELAGAIRQFFSKIAPSTHRPEMSTDERDWLVNLADFVTTCRSPVERDPYSPSREIVAIPGAEAPTRFVKVLAQLFGGLLAIILERHRAWGLVLKVGLDSMPQIRRQALNYLATHIGKHGTAEIARELDYPSNTLRRALEDLMCNHVLARESKGGSVGDIWALTESAASSYRQAICVPETLRGVWRGS